MSKKTIIQIGSNKGYDHFFNYCKSLTEPHRIFLIEANKRYIEQLNQCYESLKKYHEIHILNIGITNDKSLNKLYVPFDSDGYLGSVVNRKSLQDVIKKFEEIEFTPKLFTEFLSEYNISDIKVLDIDAEGMDYTILHSIPLDKVSIDKIYFESFPFEDDDLNNNVKTGDSFLNFVLKKYKNYNLEKLKIGLKYMDKNGCDSYSLTKKNSKILFICSGHQDNDNKLDYVINNLKILSKQNIDICYASHTDYGIDKLSKYCKYLVYDKDNLFPNESDLFNNLENIDEDRFKFLITSYFGFPFGRLNNRLFLTHSKSALSILKNSVYLANANNYDWIVYFEYDAVLPDINLKDYFEEKIQYLDNNKLDGDFYHCEGDRFPLIWPHFFISKPSLFLNDKNFNSDFSTSDSFVRLYANQFFEQILTELVGLYHDENNTMRNRTNVSIRSANEIIDDFKFTSVNKSVCEQGVLSKFSLGDKEKDENEKNSNSCANHFPWFVELYPKEIEKDVFQLLLVIYSGNTDKNQLFKLNYLSVTDDNNNSLVNLNDIELKLGHWQSYIVLNNYKLKPKEENIFVDYCIELVNVRKVNVNYKLNLNQLNKYKNFRFLE